MAISFHEFSHGYMSYLMGDPTPKSSGRLTLNPLANFDLIGTLCLLFFGFGWAKPVSINPNYYKNKKIGTALVAMAGPFSNFLLAFICAFLIKIINPSGILLTFLYRLISVNVGLGVFNLIPVPPLDGSKLLALVLPNNLYWKFMEISRYSMFILMIILYTGILNPILNIGYNLVFNFINLIL